MAINNSAATRARGSHVSPGIYFAEKDMTVVAQSLGITTLGVVGETLKGPAFEPTPVANWGEFVDYFGGTSPAKFRESNYPKYELPYIAKSYLTESNQLNVTRVLGLSGYNAGTGWAITASGPVNSNYATSQMVVAVLRSRGQYKKVAKAEGFDECGNQVYSYDKLVFDATDIEMAQYTNVNMMVNCDVVTTQKVYYVVDATAGEAGLKDYAIYRSFDTTAAMEAALKSGGQYIPDAVGKFVAITGATPAIFYISSATNGSQVYTGTTITITAANTAPTYDVAKTKGIVTNGNFIALEDKSSFENSLKINANNYGQFTLIAYNYTGNGVFSALTAADKAQYEIGRYPVSLNPGSTKDYIISVLGTTPDDGTAPIFVEELYDMSLQQLILANQLDRINSGITKYSQTVVAPVGAPVQDFLTMDETSLGRSNVGQRYVADKAAVDLGLTYHDFDKTTNTPVMDTTTNLPAAAKTVVVGHIYTVLPYNLNGKRMYYYAEYAGNPEVLTTGSNGLGNGSTGQVMVLAYDRYFMLNPTSTDVVPVACDFNDYKEPFRPAMTPWFVSQLRGDGKTIEVNKLFRFHTITDGEFANQQVKISIENIKPDEGLFDVVIRDYNDSDVSVQILERFGRCSMQEGNPNYVGLQVGTIDGDYPSRSKYVQMEIIANDVTARAVPCGFLGYPIRDYNGVQPNGQVMSNLVPPLFAYNQYYNEEVKVRRQYFGMGDTVGVDYDVLKYKGRDAYDEFAFKGYTEGFHLDSRLNKANLDVKVNVDGVYGYTWETTSPNSVTMLNIAPIIGTEDDMVGTIYETVGVRKFTAYPYGGFDGWDIYRGYRSNTDEFSATRYKAPVNNVTGTGSNFSKIVDGTSLGLTGNTISSDYYAYLAGINQYDNPRNVDISVFATPGIDYVNNKMLVDEAFEMIEERADAIYIPTTPDKPFGATDSEAEMYRADEIVQNYEDSDIDSSYGATYYPWVKFYDIDSSRYINLPATKDVVRNFAYVDNKFQPWFAPAGVYRGVVDCTRLHVAPKLSEQDTLYEGGVNPLVKQPEGPRVWGNKTMYRKDTPLNRINVRRLMIRLRKLISVAGNKLIFDPNDVTLKNQFLSLVMPILDNIKSNHGIIDYRIRVDDSAEARDRHELPCVIQVKPTQSLEYIDIDFSIRPEGVVFEGE